MNEIEFDGHRALAFKDDKDSLRRASGSRRHGARSRTMRNSRFSSIQSRALPQRNSASWETRTTPRFEMNRRASTNEFTS